MAKQEERLIVKPRPKDQPYIFSGNHILHEPYNVQANNKKPCKLCRNFHKRGAACR